MRNKLGARFHHRVRTRTGPRILAACLPDEQHELGLLIFSLAAHERGLRIVLLAAQTPMEELAVAARRARCNAIVLSSTLTPPAGVIAAKLPAMVKAARRAGVRRRVWHRLRERDGIVAAGADVLGTDIPAGVERIRLALGDVVAHEASCSTSTRHAINWTEQGIVPDGIIRGVIRRLLRARLAELRPDDVTHADDVTARFAAAMNTSPIAPLPEKANEQHYGLPPAFFGHALGPQRKYSCCHWGPGVLTLAEAEEQALALTCERAELADGQNILELGCGWGSLTLYMAKRYPQASILAVSNSALQRNYILAEASRRDSRTSTSSPSI